MRDAGTPSLFAGAHRRLNGAAPGLAHSHRSRIRYEDARRLRDVNVGVTDCGELVRRFRRALQRISGSAEREDHVFREGFGVLRELLGRDAGRQHHHEPPSVRATRQGCRRRASRTAPRGAPTSPSSLPRTRDLAPGRVGPSTCCVHDINTRHSM